VDGLRLNSVRLYGGKIAIVGLDAVVAEFAQATLTRRGDDGSAGPIWSLHASLSYQNDFFLGSDSWVKKIVLEPFKDKFYEALPHGDAVIKVDGDVLTIEGVTLCPTEPKP
jgi:hypothetical protein